MKYERKFGVNKIPLFLKIFMVMWFTILGMTIITFYEQEGSIGRMPMYFVLFSVIIFSLQIITVKRTKLFMYGDFMEYQTTFRSKDIMYSDIVRVEYSYVRGSRNASRKYYYDLIGSGDERLLRISDITLGDRAEQQEFLKLLATYNPHIEYSDEVRMGMGEEVEGTQLTTKSIQEIVEIKDVLADQIRSSWLFKLLIVAGVFIFVFPILLILILTILFSN